MSFTENDRKLQSKSGESFPIGDHQVGPSFTQTIASALKTEFGGGPSALKAVARITGANERAVRNWFEGKNGPSGKTSSSSSNVPIRYSKLFSTSPTGATLW
jgi:hypothetical protein